jgi:polyphosphate kinase 2 (PPK2 family)
MHQCYEQRVPVVIVYEGVDAGGKGGNIRRLVAEMDPRGYEVVPIGAPTPQELAHHYLWRFWKRLPKDGHFAIFDRSWYGRVLVERVEGFCEPEEWQRAYQEINEFEKTLRDHGTAIFKFWLHIDQDEQLNRFRRRQDRPDKRWKITEEDWRNREKWDQNLHAAADMIRRTNTEHAPWTIIESNDKRYARVKALRTVVLGLEKHLKGE